MNLSVGFFVQDLLGPGQFRGFSKPTPAKMKPCGFSRSALVRFVADVVVSSVGTFSGVLVFVTPAVALYRILPVYALDLAPVLSIKYTPPLNPNSPW